MCFAHRVGVFNVQGRGHGYGLLSTPAFWDVSAVPAPREQRGHAWEAGRSETTLLVRAAASFRAGRAVPERSTRGVPGSAIVRRAPRGRVVVGAQLRTRHVPVESVSHVSWQGPGRRLCHLPKKMPRCRTGASKQAQPQFARRIAPQAPPSSTIFSAPQYTKKLVPLARAIITMPRCWASSRPI